LILIERMGYGSGSNQSYRSNRRSISRLHSEAAAVLEQTWRTGVRRPRTLEQVGRGVNLRTPVVDCGTIIAAAGDQNTGIREQQGR
jgi:hypothetical protein